MIQIKDSDLTQILSLNVGIHLTLAKQQTYFGIAIHHDARRNARNGGQS